MKKQWKKILYAVMLMTFAAAGYGFYLFNKKPADIRTLPFKYELTASNWLMISIKMKLLPVKSM